MQDKATIENEKDKEEGILSFYSDSLFVFVCVFVYVYTKWGGVPRFNTKIIKGSPLKREIVLDLFLAALHLVNLKAYSRYHLCSSVSFIIQGLYIVLFS